MNIESGFSYQQVFWPFKQNYKFSVLGSVGSVIDFDSTVCLMLSSI